MKYRERFFVPVSICFGLIILVSLSLNLFAQWSNDPTVNTPICTEASYQIFPEIIGDGAGGAFIAWADDRNGPDIYAQHIDSLGFAKWTIDGIAICTEPHSQFNQEIVGDGYGGAIIIWNDDRNPPVHVYAQRINAYGTTKWATNGVEIGTGDNRRIVNDGAGGYIIAWTTYDYGAGNEDIYAQRIDSSGTLLWSAGGVPICTAILNQHFVNMIPDGEGGAIISWQDPRWGSNTNCVYAQRIDSSGTVQWIADGNLICLGAARGPKIISDGMNGAIIVWTDERQGIFNPDIYAQRVSNTGADMWATDGVAVCSEQGWQSQHSITTDGNGGVIIAWQDNRDYDDDIYAQRLNESGNRLWQYNGIEVCTDAWLQEAPAICSDGNEGAIIAWEDDRDNDNDIYAQRIDASGLVQWPTNGVPISIATEYQQSPQIAGIKSKGAIITWEDRRNGFANLDIFAQWVNAQGQLTSIKSNNATGPPREYMLAQNYPNPFNPRTVIEYSVPQKAQVEIIIYDMLGHSIKTLVSGEHAPGNYTAVWDATNDSGTKVSTGIYFYRITAGNYNAIKKMVLLK